MMMIFLATICKKQSIFRKCSPRLNAFKESFDAGNVELTGECDVDRDIAVLVDALETALMGRFDDMSKDVLAVTKIPSFSFWPSQLDDDFGDEDVKTLCKHFTKTLEKADVDVNSIGVEWDMLKVKKYKPVGLPRECCQHSSIKIRKLCKSDQKDIRPSQ
ncbi:uncharacterized protein [Diadema setosum]|uniref:uncharacterized protein n=1 Tax=Diadema setosum TaxID=31175 RepID=UPI003B3A6C7B